VCFLPLEHRSSCYCVHTIFIVLHPNRSYSCIAFFNSPFHYLRVLTLLCNSFSFCLTHIQFMGAIQFLPACRMFLAMCPEGAEGSATFMISSLLLLLLLQLIVFYGSLLSFQFCTLALFFFHFTPMDLHIQLIFSVTHYTTAHHPTPHTTSHYATLN
jgi:hypothetical protein